MDQAELSALFLESARGAGRRAPLYHRLGTGIADDPPTARLLLHAPPEQRLPVLLYACVHWILLREPDHELSRWYPNLAARHPGGPATGDPYPTFRRFCAMHEERLAELLATRSTQTNEIGRCALLLPLLARLAIRYGPLALLDVGASAGLNLLLDRFHYRYEDERGHLHPIRADPSGPGTPEPIGVELRCSTRGPVPLPPAVPPITDRIGLDRNPIDITEADEADWLRACVWPDQADRFDRLDAALSAAASCPPTIAPGDAVTDLADTAARLDPAAHLVVIDSWVLNYLTADARREFVGVLDELAASRPLSWCAVESPMLTAELPWPSSIADPHLTHLLCTDGTRRGRAIEHLGAAHPHGYWLHWSAHPT